MNLTHEQAAEWLHEYANQSHPDDVNAVILPSFTSLHTIGRIIHELDLNLAYGAQTVSEPKSGAFTGDISAGMLKALDCSYVLIGHSEQRRYHPEDDDRMADKARVIIDSNMIPIICVGETRLGREHGIGIDYALNQLADAVSLLSCDEMADVIIAYEPVWSIGTGHVPTESMIESALADIRDFINATFGADIADKVHILYGGSVTSENAANIIKCADIDGFLVGGASLDAMSFTGIINAVHDVHERDRRPTGGVSALNPPALNENMFTWKELASADALVKAHADTHAWRAQLALAAYRAVGFQWLERNAAETLLQNIDSSGADTEFIASNPDLLRDAIWDDRRDIILRIMRIIDNHGLRGVKSVDEWLVMQDDGLTHDERCERLTAARADYNADVAYDELMDGSIPRDVFDAIFKAGYYAADADTRERHWRRRGIDKHAWRG